LVLPAPDK
jgi:hypothetical protein